MAGAVGAAKTSTSKVEGSPSAECLRSRRRREAAKAALFHLENSVHQAALELRALHKEREALNDEELALTQLTEHQAQLYAALSAAHAARALRESRMVGEGAANEVERLVVHAFNTGEYPNDEWFRWVEHAGGQICTNMDAFGALGHHGAGCPTSDPSFVPCSKKYLSFPVELMVRIEKTFMSLLDNTMAQVRGTHALRPILALILPWDAP